MIPGVSVRSLLTTDGNGNSVALLAVKTPYHADFVEELKEIIPPGDRAYDSSTKTWIVDAAYRHEILDLIDYYFTEEFAEVRARGWQHRLESTAEHYCKLHYSLREVRKKKIPNKDLLLLVMEEQKVPVSQYNSIYQLCRKKLPTFYAWYAGEVLKGRIER